MNLAKNIKPVIETVKRIVPLKEAYLFDSFAYGKPNKDSDYDIYLIVDKINGSTSKSSKYL